jgi:hypothetical protein
LSYVPNPITSRLPEKATNLFGETRSFPGYFGSSQGFFEGMAVIGGHIGGEDNRGYGQRVVQMKRASTEVKVLIIV